MTDGFGWFDSDGRLVLCNQKCRDLYPRLAAELKPGASYTELLKLAFDREHDSLPAGEESALRAWPWPGPFPKLATRSEEHTSELQSLLRISYAVFCLKKKINKYT